ncbi:MAG: hypothetical protein L0211_19985 [Planctomycetaceae bacterium]|nr:hypothetical protein [Planctomycetaceae bacterium]
MADGAVSFREALRDRLFLAIRPIAAVFPVYYFSAVIVVLGVLFGSSFLPLQRIIDRAKRETWSSGFLAWDGAWYKQVAQDGYSSTHRSRLNFYPGYPGLAAALSKATGLSVEVCLLLVSHGCFLASLAIFSVYLRGRENASAAVTRNAVLSLCLFPTTLYFRMAYSESLFLFAILAFAILMQRGASIVTLAVIAGAATAIRPVGIALILPWVVYTWRTACPRLSFLWRATILLPICIWGLAAYMAYQWAQFGDPLLFTRASEQFVLRQWPATLEAHLAALATLEPIRAVYDPATPGYWGRFPPHGDSAFSLQFANPIYFLFAFAMLGLGAWKRWLTSDEIMIGLMLLLVPYALNGYRSCMAGQARYASVVFPMYIVLGELLQRMPSDVRISLLALSAVGLFIYSAFFSSWYWFT